MLLSILSWFLGVASVPGLYLAGKHDWRGWAWILFTEIFWVWFAIVTGGWGLLVGCVAYSWVAALNLWKWKRGT